LLIGDSDSPPDDYKILLKVTRNNLPGPPRTAFHSPKFRFVQSKKISLVKENNCSCRFAVIAENPLPPPFRCKESAAWRKLIFSAILNAEVKTGFILIPEGDLFIHNGAQPGNDADEQQIDSDHLQPGPVHALSVASGVPACVCFICKFLPV
jgi:hypothetical protein